MVLAYHVIFCAYGFWLPNDPRGSWSDWVRRWELLRFGEATKTNTRRSVANAAHDRQAREAAKQAMRYPPVSFTGRQALSIANGFKHAVRRSGYGVLACSILPEHVHAVVDRAGYNVEYVVGQLKGEATKRLKADGLHPFGEVADVPTPWARGCWKVFLNDDAGIERAVRYVEGNPLKEGKRRQDWSFVVPFGR